MIAFTTDPRVRAQLLAALTAHKDRLRRNGKLLHPELLALLRELDVDVPPRAVGGQVAPLSAPQFDSAHSEGMALLLSIQQAAQLLGISERTVKRRIRDGSLPSGLVGGLRRIRRDDIEAIASSRSSRRA